MIRPNRNRMVPNTLVSGGAPPSFLPNLLTWKNEHFGKRAMLPPTVTNAEAMAKSVLESWDIGFLERPNERS